VRAHQRGMTSDRTKGFIDPCRVLIKNVCGADRSRFDVLQLGAPLLLDSGDLVDPVRLVFEADTMAHQMRHGVVLLEPIPDDGIGWAQAQGSICAAKVDIVREGHRRASFEKDGYSLTSNMIGPIELIWKPSGTGVKTCTVLLTPTTAKIVGKTQSGGVSAASWNGACDELTPGTGTIDVYEWDIDNEKYVEVTDGSGNVDQDVYNIATGVDGAVGENKFVAVATDDDCVPTVEVEDCEDGCT